MKQVYVSYILCDDAKEVEKLKEICAAHGAYANFSHNPPKGKMLYEVIAFTKTEAELIKKKIKA